MLASIVVAVSFLGLLAWSWGLYDIPDNQLSGWVYAAYGIVFTVIAGYRTSIDARARSAWRLAFERPRPAGPGSPAPGRSLLGGVFEQVSLSALAVGLLLSLVYAPQEKTMGQLQRIFYIHVPCAWVAGLAFAVVFASSIAYLSGQSLRADRVARASAEVGVVFTTLVLVSGPIWARPAWGIWWTWDARLTTTFILWLVYLGYLMLRGFVPDPEKERRLAAVVGILGFIGVLIDYKAIVWWRTQHPQPVMGGGEGSGLDPAMKRAFFTMLIAMTLVYLSLLWRRLELARVEEWNEAE